MTPEVERILEAAFEVSADRRKEFVHNATTDPGVRREVLSLLAHGEIAESFFDGAVQGMASSLLATVDLAPGMVVGAYRITSLVGRGGMGAVYLAGRSDSEVDQEVAIKVIQSVEKVDILLDRFRQERRILARLNHPNIAHFLDAGQTPQGSPYLVMEYVRGEAIDQYCDRAMLSVPARLQLFLKVCDAVQHAHQSLIVHRDLKPGNILVTAEGEPKLLDFGIAKVLDPTESDAGQTSTRALTPDYASPEQVRGDPITTVCDVYSLGAVLYRILTGRAPHETRSLSPLEIVQAIAQTPVPSARGIRPDLAADIEAILAKALRKDPARRYRSVEEFAADIRRYLLGRPVLASPDSFLYRTRKFIRRNWISVTAAAAVAAALAAGAGVATWQARRAERRFSQVRKLANTFLFDFEQSIRPLAGATAARQLVIKTALEYLESLAQEARGDAELMRELAAAYRKVGEIQGDTSGGNIGDVAGALRSYRQAVELLDSIGDRTSPAGATQRNYVSAVLRLGGAHTWSGDLTESLRLLREAGSIVDGLLLREPQSPDNLMLASDVYERLGEALVRNSDLRGALDSRIRSIDMLRAAAKTNPTAERRLPDHLSAVGATYEKLRDTGKAVDSYRQAIAGHEALLEREPQNLSYQRGLMITAARLSAAIFLLSKPAPAHIDEAIALSRRALEIAEASAKADPRNARAISDLMATTSRLAAALYQKGALVESADVFYRAALVSDDSVRRDPRDREAALNRALCHGWYGEACARLGKMADAIRERRFAEAEYARLAAMAPNDTKILVAQASNWLDLGRTLFRAGNVEEAERCARQGTELARRLMEADPANREIRDYLAAFERQMSALKAGSRSR